MEFKIFNLSQWNETFQVLDDARSGHSSLRARRFRRQREAAELQDAAGEWPAGPNNGHTAAVRIFRCKKVNFPEFENLKISDISAKSCIELPLFL